MDHILACTTVGYVLHVLLNDMSCILLGEHELAEFITISLEKLVPLQYPILVQLLSLQWIIGIKPHNILKANKYQYLSILTFITRKSGLISKKSCRHSKFKSYLNIDNRWPKIIMEIWRKQQIYYMIMYTCNYCLPP